MAADLIIRFLGDTKEFSAKLEKAQQKLAKFGDQSTGAGDKLKQGLMVGATAAIGAAVAIGGASLEMADKFEASHARLTTAIANTGGSWDVYKGRVDDVDRQLENLGFTNADTESALAKLVGATHDTGKAIGLMGLAADVARGRNVDLGTATDYLVKAETGHVGSLGRLGVNLKDNTGKTVDAATALQRLSDLYKGDAAHYAETFSGKLAVLKAKGEDLGKAIGLDLIPVIETMASDGLAVVRFLEGANAATGGFLGRLALFGGVGLLAIGAISKISEGLGAMRAAFAATEVAEGEASSGMLAIIAANPELLVLAGTVAVVAAAWHSFGDQAHYANLQIDDMTNSQLVDWIEKIKTGIKNKGGGVDFSQALDENKIALGTFKNALKEGLPEAQRFIDAMGTAGLNTSAETKLLKERIKAQAESNITQQKANTETEKATADLNKSADAQKAAATATKAHNTALSDLAKVAGTADAKIVAGMGLSTDAIKNMTAAVKQMNTDFESSFDSATSVLDKFKDKSHVDFEQFIKDQAGALLATANWSSNIAQLAKDGIDKGFLETLVKAGPSEAGLVQSILDNVSHGSIKTINNMQAAANRIKAQTESTLDGLVTGATQRMQELAALKANMTVMINGIPVSAAIFTGAAQLNLGVAQRIGRHAAGGPIGAGQLSWVGEQGPELVQGLAGGGVQVFSNSRSRRIGGGGGNSYTIHVATLDAKTAGTAVIEAIRSYERANGTGWRN